MHRKAESIALKKDLYIIYIIDIRKILLIYCKLQ
jgi:hypothetical protein